MSSNIGIGSGIGLIWVPTIAVMGPAFIAAFCGVLGGFGAEVLLVPIILSCWYLLSKSVDVALVLYVLGCTHWLMSLCRLIYYRKKCSVAAVMRHGFLVAFASALGAFGVFLVGGGLYIKLLGAFLIIYAPYVLCIDFVPKKNFSVVLTCGMLVEGFVAGFFGAVDGVVHYFLVPHEEQKEYTAAMSGNALCMDTARCLVYWYYMYQLNYDYVVSWGNLILIVAVFCGIAYGVLFGTAFGQPFKNLFPNFVRKLIVCVGMVIWGIMLILKS